MGTWNVVQLLFVLRPSARLPRASILLTRSRRNRGRLVIIQFQLNRDFGTGVLGARCCRTTRAPERVPLICYLLNLFVPFFFASSRAITSTTNFFFPSCSDLIHSIRGGEKRQKTLDYKNSLFFKWRSMASIK